MYSLILLNGGRGTRTQLNEPKQFLKINGIPILVYSLIAADDVPEISEIVLNYPSDWRESVEEILDAYAIKTPWKLVEAGASRNESVRLCLDHVSNDRVLIHESARPMVSARDFSRLIEEEQENVSLMLEIPFTVAPVDPVSRQVTGYLNRAELRNVQLPQRFSVRDLRAAHEYVDPGGRTFTEDATLAVEAGLAVWFIEGSDRNLKVTTPTDIRLVEFLLTGGADSDE